MKFILYFLFINIIFSDDNLKDIRHKTNNKYLIPLGEYKYRFFLRTKARSFSKAFILGEIKGKKFEKQLIEIGNTRGKQYFYIDLFIKDIVSYKFKLVNSTQILSFTNDKSDFSYNPEDVNYNPNKSNSSLNNIYQILIDKFRKGEESISLEDLSNKKVWNSNFDNETLKENQDVKYYGDFLGIIEKLNYIKSLNVDTIHLSPIFCSKSSHKFDVTNLNISKDFVLNKNETDKMFSNLCKEAHKLGIKIIIEFPITYLSTESDIFLDILYKGKQSKYFNWFQFSNDTFDEKLVKYEGTSSYLTQHIEGIKYRPSWIKIDNSLEDKSELLSWNLKNLKYKFFQNCKSLPLLNLKNDNVIKYLKDILYNLISGEDKKILDLEKDDGIDGIVYTGEISNEVVKVFRELKTLKDISFIYNNLSCKYNNESDALYNYRFASNILEAINSKSPYRIDNLKTSLKLFSLRCTKPVINILSSWDVERFYSGIINYNSSNKNYIENDKYKNINPFLIDSTNEDIFKIGLTIQMTYEGIPSTYYGDEVGMYGSSDPYNRKPMLWEDLSPYKDECEDYTKYKDLPRYLEKDDANKKVYYDCNINKRIQEHFKKLVNIRSKYKNIFAKGKVDFLKLKGNDILCYKRVLGKEEIYIIINLSDKNLDTNISIERKGIYLDLLSEEEFGSRGSTINIKLKSFDVKLLHRK